MQEIAARVMKDELARRMDALTLFRPSEQQEEVIRQMAIDGGLEYLVGGGNQSGKSTVVAAIMASIILDRPITLRNGEHVFMRPERWRGEPMKIWMVGYDHKHNGKTMFRLLFTNENVFRIVKDKATKQFRAYDPDNPEDKGRYKESRPAPPFIKMSDIEGGEDGISWENKKERQVASCTMARDGTRVEFFASTGSKPQGDPVHVIWCDEKLDDDYRWYSELLMRLARYEGKLIWTSWPDTDPSPAIAELQKRAEQTNGLPNQKSFAFRLIGSKNPHTRNEHREYALSTMDEDTRLARDEGLLNMDRWRTYPRFNKFVHRAIALGDLTDAEKEQEWESDTLSACIRKYNGIPANWTRYLILDPGTANPGVLFVAVPPPFVERDGRTYQIWDKSDITTAYIVPYDELYIPYTDAVKLAGLVADKTKGQFFEDFIADAHACRIRPMGFSGTVGMNYEKEFAKHNLSCRRHGSRFSYGSDNVDSRIMMVQNALTINKKGFPRLRILGCPKLCEQLEKYRWARDPKGNPTDKPDKYQAVDLAVCLEYFVSREDCGYFAPPEMKPEDDPNSLKSLFKGIASKMGLGKVAKGTSIYCGAAPQ